MSKFAPHRKGTNNPPATANTVCQKCLGRGHYIYECKTARPYVSRPSRTELLEKPNAITKLKKDGQPSVELPEEFKTKAGTANKILEERERLRKEFIDSETDLPSSIKRKRSPSPSEDSSTSSSDLESSSSSSSNSDSSEDSDSNSSISSKYASKRTENARRKSR